MKPTRAQSSSGLALSLPVVDGSDFAAAAGRCVMVAPGRSTTRIAVKRQNIAKWPPRRHGGYLAKHGDFADADQNLLHSCPSGQGADEVAAGP